VPDENVAMPERSVTQWGQGRPGGSRVAEIDVLALSVLSAIRRALDMVSDQRDEHFEMRDISAMDPQTCEMISQSDTVNVFQIESRARMSMLPRLKPRTFYDLMIGVVFVHPGPIQGGAERPHQRRCQVSSPSAIPARH
jgi:error-prone DNA polymerase